MDPAVAATDHLNWFQQCHPMRQAPTMVQAHGPLLYGRLGSKVEASLFVCQTKRGVYPHDVAVF